MILENGVIRTMDASVPVARALAIAGDEVVGGVGTHERALAPPDRVDLRGRCVVPGFADAHTHFPTWALALDEVRLEDTRSLDEALERVREAMGSVRAGGWLRGRGWRSGDWSPQVEPTRQVLDAVTGETPAALLARDSHSLWLNSAALARADGDLNVPGGVVEVDERGEPTGVLREESAWHFRDTAVEIADAEYVAAMRRGLKVAASRGVTSIHDKDGWIGALGFWQTLHADGALNLRVWQSLPHERVDELAALGIRSGFGDEWLRVGYLKAFMDGTLGSQTARLLDGTGVEITSRDELAEIVRRAARAGFPVAVHAIGDRANREALDAFEETRDEWAPLGLRQRIEHAQLVAPEDVPRFGELGVTASVQFSHAPSDRDLAERFWAGRVDGAYAYRSLRDAGALLVNGSDAPIEELDPWAGVVAGRATHPGRAAAVAGRAGRLAGGGTGRDDREPGLAGGRRASARPAAPRLPRRPGRPGSRPVHGARCDELPDVHVVATMAGGRWVHGSPPWE